MDSGEQSSDGGFHCADSHVLQPRSSRYEIGKTFEGRLGDYEYPDDWQR